MKYISGLIFPFLLFLQIVEAQNKFAGNPVLKGWYADPEAVVFGKQYWIYPTYSDKYNKQVFFDAFSSTDLVHWEKHEHILDTSAIRWAKRAMWVEIPPKQTPFHRVKLTPFFRAKVTPHFRVKLTPVLAT